MIEIYKKRYQTCLEALEHLRLEKPEFKNEVLSYNGILDPMAEGVLPVLVGSDENKRRGEFTGSRKRYRVAVLVGVSTDSSDLLGIVNLFSMNQFPIEKVVETFLGHPRKFKQTVPMHSNRKVDGKRLWWWILNGVKIPEERRPSNDVEILELKFLEKRILLREELLSEITEMKKHIGERFRLGTVIASWNRFFEGDAAREFTLLEFELYVTSGFYVRTFVETIGKKLQVPLMVYSLKRTEVNFS